MRLRLTAAVLAAALSGAATAQEPLTFEAVADRYFKSRSYCDQGKAQRRLPGDKTFTVGQAWKRCARSDGRFKFVEAYGDASIITWWDGTAYHRYVPRGGRYQKVSLDDPLTSGHYRNRAEIYPVFMFERLTGEGYRFGDPAVRTAYLRSFVRSVELSGAEHTVFERFPAPNQGERIWVRNADRSIVRSEALYNGVLMSLTEIASHEFDRPLSDAELAEAPWFFERYSLMNNPAVFIAGLIAASGFAGMLLWGMLFARTGEPETLRARRHLLWKLQFWIFGVLALLLAGLAALTWGGKGHPPAIAFVAVIAIWTAVAFAMTALFTLASYPVERLMRKA